MNTSDQVSGDDDVGTQDEPVMDHDAVSDSAKLHGIVVQTISDLGAQHPLADIEAVIQSRSVESGLNYSASEVSAAVHDELRQTGPENTFNTDADR